MPIRPAATADVKILAEMNQQLIRDEAHRNPMTLAELEQRMSGWLAAEYAAAVFEENGNILGYALYRHNDEYTYLRHLYVVPNARRRGIGRALINWLVENVSIVQSRLRIEVLIENRVGIEFWRAAGFRDYCLTMELKLGN